MGYSPIVLTPNSKYASYPVKDASFELEIDPRIKVIGTKSTEPLQWFSKIFGSKKVPYSGFSNVDTDSFISKVSRWVRGNLFIPDARKYWNRHALRAAVEIIKNEGIDFVITTGPPHSTHLIGKELKSKFGVNWIADFRDPWTDIYYYSQLLHTKWAKQQDLKLETAVLENADLVLSVCPSNFELIAAKSDALKQKMALVPNGYDPDDFEGLTRQKKESIFVLAYMGTMASTYNMDPILQTLSELTFEWKLVIAGVISPEIETVIKQYGIEGRIEKLGYLPHKEALQVICSADMLLHVVPDVDGARMGTTGKLFEYIGSEVPIVNFGDEEGDSARFISQAQCGRTFNRNDATGVMNYLLGVRNGTQKFNSQINKFSRESTSKELVNAIARKFGERIK